MSKGKKNWHVSVSDHFFAAVHFSALLHGMCSDKYEC